MNIQSRRGTDAFILESHDIGNGRRYITYFKPGEYFVCTIIKFLVFLFLL